ncbi:MAG: FAD-binding protein [Planctomycetes bacterium]|nr:FAD-binding protein [Planctomycetota bacterium]
MISSLNWPCAALSDADLSDRTTMRVGGRALWLLEPADPNELRAAYSAARERGFVPRILGGGANLVIEDGLYRGVVIATDRLKRCFRPLGPVPDFSPHAAGAQVAPAEPSSDPRLIAWCGATMPSLVQTATALGLSGFECLAGVPGHLGGGIAMNAGGRHGEIWNMVELVRVIEPDGTMHDLPRAECTPRYRNGGLGERVVVGAVLRLVPSTPSEVRDRTREYLLEKRRVQPVTEWSAGCVFKNPDPARSNGCSAGKLVELAGLKGRTRGDAIVSPLHGNFILNRGAATATDVLGLIDEVRAEVASRSGVELEVEVKIWRADPA